MGSGERMDSGQIGTWAVQDGPKIVLVRSFFRLVVRDRFFGRLGLLLGSFLAAPKFPEFPRILLYAVFPLYFLVYDRPASKQKMRAKSLMLVLWIL